MPLRIDAPPENAKSCFPEIRNPVFGTSNSRVAPPENAKSFFPEIRNPVFGTSNKIIRAKWPPFSNMVSFL
jgi:hypothetical protein